MLLAGVVGALSLRVTGISFAMVTLAFAQAGAVLVRQNPGKLTGGDEGLTLDTTHVPDVLVGVLNTRNLYWLCLAVLVVVFLISTWFEHSRAGHVAVATRENELRVRVIGIRPYFIKLLIFVVAGVLATVVGMAYLLLQSSATQRLASADFTLTILVIVVLGGVGLRWGAVVGGVVYTLLDQRLTALASSDAINSLPDVLRVPLSEPMFILGSLFILVVLFLPGGIAGVALRLSRRGHRAKDARDVLEEVVCTDGLHTLGRWTRDRALATGDRIAVDDRGVVLTYRELDDRASRLAQRLRGSGYGIGDRIATITGNSADQVVLFFACAKAGLALVPLSWRLSPRELALQIELADPALLLVEDEFDTLAAAARKRLVQRRRASPALGGSGIEAVPSRRAAASARPSAGRMSATTMPC